MIRNSSQVNLDMEKTIKKWKPIVEKLGKFDDEKIERLCEYAELHAATIQSDMIKENVAYANPANTAGMGAVSFPSLSGTPGLVGTAGSGDLGQTLLPGALKIAANTFGLELLPVINVNSNRVDLLYWDWTYDDTNGFDNDERSSTIKITTDAALSTFIRARMTVYGITEMRGRISAPLYFHLSTGGGDDLGVAYDQTVAPSASASKTGWVQFVGFSRIDDLPMFRIYTQQNTSSSGAWTFDANLNTFPATGALTTLLTARTIDTAAGGLNAGGQAVGTVTAISLVSLNEDVIDGFTTGKKYGAGLTRGAWETDEAGKIGPNSFTKSVEIGVAHVSAALRLSEIGDYKRMYGIDIVEKTKAQLINQLAQKISIEIVEKVKELGLRHRAAFGTAFDFDIPTMTTALGGEHNASVVRKLWAKVIEASYHVANEGRIGGIDYVICSGKVASALRSIAGYTILPMDVKMTIGGQLSPAGTIDGIKIYVDPFMAPGDLTVYMGRIGKKEDPGIKFLAYMLAESVEITSEKTMGPRLYMYSRYAVVEFGFFPEKQFFAMSITDTDGIL